MRSRRMTRMSCAVLVAGALALAGCQSGDKGEAQGQQTPTNTAPSLTPSTPPTSSAPEPSKAAGEELVDPAVALKKRLTGSFAPLLDKKGSGTQTFKLAVAGAGGLTDVRVGITCAEGKNFKVAMGSLVFMGVCNPQIASWASFQAKQAGLQLKTMGKTAIVTVPKGTKFWIVVVPKES